MLVIEELTGEEKDFWENPVVNEFYESVVFLSSNIPEGKEEKKDDEKDDKSKSPSFSLGIGLSQDSTEHVLDPTPLSFVPQVESKVISTSDIVDSNPMAIVVASEVGLDGNARVSREKKLTLPLKSPYKNRIVDVKTKLTAEEIAVSEWLFNFRGEMW